MKAGWMEVQLGEVITDARPGFACGADIPGGVLQVRMNNVTVDGVLDFSRQRRVPDDARARRYALQSGDVLFNATNSPELVGKTALFRGRGEPVVFSNHFLRIRTDQGRLISAYLARWMQFQHRRGVFGAMAQQWVNQAAVRPDRLLKIALPLPPLDEQRRIVRALDAAEALRAKRRGGLEMLKQMTSSVFVAMFGDPVVNPRGWPIAKLGALGDLGRGVSTHRPRNAPELLGGPYPLIQTGDVARSGSEITAYSSTYSEDGLKQSRLWPAGTLCITIAANIAKTGVVAFDACFPDSVVGFTADPTMTTYVQAWFSFLQPTLERSAPESAQKNINLAILRELPIPAPPPRALTSFATRVNAIRATERLHANSLAELDSLASSLQSRAFTGEL